MSLSRAVAAIPALTLFVVIAAAPRASRAPVPETDPPYCWHDKWTDPSTYHCGDTTSLSANIASLDGPRDVMRAWGPSAEAESFQSGPDTLVVRTTNRGLIRIPLPAGYDGILLSKFAVDTFLAVAARDAGQPERADSIRAWAARNWGDEDRMWLGCFHFPEGPGWRCSNARWVNPRNVTAINIIHHARGMRYVLRPGRGADAVMVTKTACEKLLLQYYEKKYRGLEGAINGARWP